MVRLPVLKVASSRAISLALCTYVKCLPVVKGAAISPSPVALTAKIIDSLLSGVVTRCVCVVITVQCAHVCTSH